MRLAVINDYQNLAREAADWSQLPDEVEADFFQGRLTDAEDAADLLAPYDIVVTAREETPFDRALIERLPKLKCLVTHGQRNAALDMQALAERQITVCGTGYGFPIATVELTWGLILSLLKHIPSEDRAMREGKWGIDLPLGLSGRTLGVVGLGTLGSGVARVGKAFDMDVIAWSENLTDARCAEIGVEQVDKDTLFKRADIVSVHLILGDRSRGTVGAREIGLMKPTALLINTARGPIVDEAALISALETGAIAGAGLDVYDQEPLPVDHKLRTQPNTVLMPHVGGRTRENFIARYRDSLEDVQAWLAGNPIRVLS
ncbi:MAG: D-2-hydroxyacid dehydrogenase family protein [Alphaproteobacteria bacterium]|nr:D-2-hydroxyacid dehydrogenase family protein [Alphaproteobacteria bacterium]